MLYPRPESFPTLNPAVIPAPIPPFPPNHPVIPARRPVIPAKAGIHTP